MNRWWALLTIVIVIGCGGGEQAGGSGMEIPNAVSCTAVHSNGAPVVHGRVRIVTESHWMANILAGKPVVLDSQWTDSLGRFAFVPPATGRVRIEIVSSDEGLSVVYDSSATEHVLAKLGTVSVQYQPNALLRIIGTSYMATADAQGHAVFAAMPGVHSGLIGQNIGVKPVLLSPLDLLPGSTISVDSVIHPDSLVVDDFENASAVALLDPYLHGSFWYSVADQNEGGQSTVYPSTAQRDSWSQAVSDSATVGGKALTIRYRFQWSDSTDAFVIFGCTLGNGINGGAIDSIQFLSVSDGAFDLTSGQSLLYHGKPDSSGWTRHVIRRSDLDLLGVDSTLGLLQFVLNDTAGSVFRLDDFVIYGDPIRLLANP